MPADVGKSLGYDDLSQRGSEERFALLSGSVSAFRNPASGPLIVTVMANPELSIYQAKRDSTNTDSQAAGRG